jgi:hypothetical protein
VQKQVLGFDLAFPDMNNFPARVFQGIFSSQVIAFVPADLFQPPFCSCFGYHKVPAAVMTVPEATVDKDDRFVFWQYNIGLAWQCFYVKTVTKTCGKKKFPDAHFGFGIGAPDTGHIEASGFL